MMNSELKVLAAWLLLVPLVVSSINAAFAAYRADAKLWKLFVHAAALICLGLLIVDLGMVCLRIQYDLTPTYKTQFSAPKLVSQRAKGAAKPARPAAPAKQKPGPKK
jgi:hypothetical protein